MNMRSHRGVRRGKFRTPTPVHVVTELALCGLQPFNFGHENRPVKKDGLARRATISRWN